MEQDTDELSPAERRVIELSRAARTPGEADKRRVRAALALSLGAVAGGATGAAVASTVTAAKGTATLLGARVIAAVLLAASAGTGAYVWLRNKPTASPVVETAPAPAAVPAPAPVVEPIAPAEDPLLAEVSLLQRAQRALKQGQPKEAMELAARHATLYPTSQMALERDALRVFSLCALGRKGEARTLARALLAQAPTSPLRASLEESCALR